MEIEFAQTQVNSFLLLGIMNLARLSQRLAIVFDGGCIISKSGVNAGDDAQRCSGIVAAPDEAEHSYQVMTKKAAEPYVGPDEWIKLAPAHEGSWWVEWVRFLAAHSGSPVPPPAPEEARSLQDAPGSYVLQR